MITEEEKQEIIDRAVEKALLLIPETVGNMMAHQASLSKANREFYSKYPEFKNEKDSVVSVIEKIEGENPLLDYEKLLEKSIPEIRRRIGTLKNLNVVDVPSNPSRSFEHGEL